MARPRAYSLELVRLYLAGHPRDSFDASARNLVDVMAPMSYDTARRYIRKARALPPLDVEPVAAREELRQALTPPAPVEAVAPPPAPPALPVRPQADRVLSRRATLQAWLQRNPTAQAKQVAYQFGVSHQTALSDLAAYNMPAAKIRYRK